MAEGGTEAEEGKLPALPTLRGPALSVSEGEPEAPPPPAAPNWRTERTPAPSEESARPVPALNKLPVVETVSDEEEEFDLPPPPTRARPAVVLPGVRAKDAVTEPTDERIRVTTLEDPITGTYRRKSLMQPQDLAARILPRDEYERLSLWNTGGCPADCGPPWEPAVIEAAKNAGPHTSACSPENVELIWDDIQYQEEAGFVRVVSESVLFGGDKIPEELKMSRVAVVPQENRRGRIILNLSAEVNLGRRRATGRRRWKDEIHPSVNETTAEADEQAAVKALGTALGSLLMYMFDTTSTWEIDWQKVDLSDGFWRMITEAGKEYNFVFQLPEREGDTERHYVVPSSLQMGWKNSPAFFCTGTEATRCLIKRLLALTMASGIDVEHRHESYCVNDELPSTSAAHWKGLADATLACRVFVDDFMQGLAGDPERPERRDQQLWVSRAVLHGIHAVFPPPDVLDHAGGKDSVSQRKLDKGDALFKLREVLLGFLMSGGAGSKRTVAVPVGKFDKYVGRLRKALDQPNNYITFSEFQKIHGQMQHVSVAIPCLRGLMTPLNQQLSRERSTVGLRVGGTLRATFEIFATLIEDAQTHPSHIAEIVPPDLPHYHGTTDASGVGAGGVWLPCTEWLHPTVWRLEWPDDIKRAVRNGTLSMVDCEFAAYFIAECMIDDLSERPVAGLSTFLWTDNSPTEAIVQRQASRAKSTMPEATLRWLALRQRWTRRGPQDIKHYPGKDNLMADFPSRSFSEGYPDEADDEFLTEFDLRFPLPPQLRYWVCVRPSKEISSAAFSLLRKQINCEILETTVIGSFGVGLPIALAKTLSSPESRTTLGPTTWGESGCSFPLLLPCGKVCTTVATNLRDRRSRAHFSKSPSSWTSTDLETLANSIRPPTS